MNKLEAMLAFSRNVNKVGIEYRDAFLLLGIYYIQLDKGKATVRDIIKSLGVVRVSPTIQRMRWWLTESPRSANSFQSYTLNEAGEKMIAELLNLKPKKNEDTIP